MKTPVVFTLLLLTLSSLVAGQTPALNQLDSSGKKHGKWLLYLDKNWKKVEDSTQALFCRYTYFDQGVNIYPMGPVGKTGYRLSPAPAVAAQTPALLNGEYKWYDAKGRLSSEHVFKNGLYVSCKEYFSTGGLHQHFDYTPPCDAQPHGWSITIYDKKGQVKLKSRTCKDKNGKWPRMRG